MGLIVNPIAGMGGSVGLKGTDGEMAGRARELGAAPVTPQRTLETLRHLAQPQQITWLAAPDSMGTEYLDEREIAHTVVGTLEPAEGTTAQDTRRIARQMAERGAELLLFVGGDGTARDIYDAVRAEVPVVGVPAGVKVYSAAFALSPRAAAEMVDAFASGETGGFTLQEVLDIDEAAFRADRLEAQHYGYLLVPDVPAALQPGKEGSRVTPDAEANKADIAADVVESMRPGALYLLGPGTTIKAIAGALDIAKTLLGVDAVVDGELVGTDLNEQAILALLEEYDLRQIIVTPLGGNGFIFGRGNKQFTPAVLRTVGRANITVVATEEKVNRLDTLRVDTGDAALDRELSGYQEVTVGYKLGKVMRVKAA